MRQVLVDSNVILDVVTEDRHWYAWSSSELAGLADDHALIINPIIYSEVSVGFTRVEDLEAALPAEYCRREPLPWDAGFLAGKCFLRYRRAKGSRHSPLQDFYIGAHAAVRGIPLLTRDAARYKTYLPQLILISP